MNLSRSKTLIGLLYAVILSLPLLNIAGRVLYTQWNKNAKDSYSGEISYTQYEKVGLYQSNEVNSNSDLINGNIYEIYISDYHNDFPIASSYYELYFDIIYAYALPYGDFTLVDTYMDDWGEDPLSYFSIYSDGAYDGNTINYKVAGIFADYYTIINHYECIFDSTDDEYFENEFILYGIYLSADGYISPNETADLSSIIHYTDYNVYEYQEVEVEVSTLDNAFEYSISKITDNNIGEVQFFTWFADLFLDLDNATNMLYVGFVNWYFNYALLVSLGYLMFMVLMWFVGLARKILEKGQNFGEGGY